VGDRAMFAVRMPMTTTRHVIMALSGSEQHRGTTVAAVGAPANLPSATLAVGDQIAVDSTTAAAMVNEPVSQTLELFSDRA